MFRSKNVLLVFVVLMMVSACAPAVATETVTTEEPTSVAQISTPEAAEAPVTEVAETAAFPVTIAHKYGETTITEKPERIVLVGLVEQDALLAFGVVPVATREWWGERPGAVFEWATDELGDAPLPEVLPANELNFEQIAALEPDVIVGLYAGITQEEYDTLAKIAPTVAQPAEYPDWGIPWQELTHKIGLIVGEAERADALIAEVEAQFTVAREAHPEFAGQTGIVASTWGYPDTYWVYSSKDPRSQFLLSLGFNSVPAFDEVIGNEFGATISREEIDMLNDVNVAIWFGTEEEMSDPLYQQLAISQQGRNIVIASEAPMAFAFSFNTVLSLPYVLDGLVPQLSVAVDGDPATVYTE
ncbi:MAG: iron-siderophore ABC transporter substrate-binding protein [Anaerolineales bacterium]|nr:iron-siderophore ABC transporter substrate-binding protein [Anaerolineales bacterium]